MKNDAKKGRFFDRKFSKNRSLAKSAECKIIYKNPIDFNNFMVRAVQKSIRKMKKTSKTNIEKVMQKTLKNHQKSDKT